MLRLQQSTDFLDSMKLETLAISFALLLLASCGNSEKKPEELLATIDGQPQDVQSYAVILDQLVPKCNEDRMMLADMSVKSQQLLAEKGVKESNLSIITAVSQPLASYTKPQDCSAVFVAIVQIAGQK